MSLAHAPTPATPVRPLRDPSTRRIAIVRLRVGLGDLLASVPALRAIRSARPDLEVVMVTWPEVAPVVQRMAAYVDELLAFPGWPGIPERPVRHELVGTFLTTARSRRFDLAVQMYGALPAANQVTEALGAGRTAGFFTPGDWRPGDLGTHLPYPHRDHEARRHLRLVNFLGAPPGDDSLEFPVWDTDRDEAAELQARHGLRPGEYVVVHPGATAASRRWPAERFAAVADHLAGRDLRVLITGAAGEESLTGAVAAAMTHRSADACGATSLGGLAAVLADAALLVGNDTGTAQLAAALGVPSVTVFLAGDPGRWAAADGARHRVVAAGAPCSPCGLLECPIDFRCATDIDPAAVAAVAAEVLDDLARAGRLT